MDELSAHQRAASSQPHDAHGHFAPKPHTVIPEHPSTTNPVHPLIQAMFPHGVEVDHKVTNDDLVDVHVGNPLRRITALLEEIKKQKAFSFTLKGSLGLAGIVLVLGTFGFFGGTHVLCSKGIQSEVGTLTILNAVDTPQRIPGISMLSDVLTILSGKQIQNKDTPRVVLIRQDGSVLHLPASSAFNSKMYEGKSVIVTGELDSCSNTVSIDDTRGIQIY